MPILLGFRRFGRAAFMAAAVVCLAGCTHSLAGNGLGGPTVTRVDASELPGPDGQVGANQVYVHKIGPMDKLIVDVLGIEQLSNRRLTVDGSGNITLPIAGLVHVGGLTLAEATDQLVRQLNRGYVRNPQVAINLEESLSEFYTVDGQVQQPGNYPIASGITLMRAVASARGASEFAKLREVVIHRTVNGQQMLALYDLGAIRAGAYSDPVLYPRDIVVVGDSPSRRLLQQFAQLSPLVLSPLITLLQYK
jgi:polysaccharide export outer membrane protein